MALDIFTTQDYQPACDSTRQSINDIENSIKESIDDNAEFSGICRKYIVDRGYFNYLL